MNFDENNVQPLDTLMTQLGVSNADLVNASTEQLSFKMVQKGRKGRRITPNIQEKILTALLKLKPQLRVYRRDLFRYELNEEAMTALRQAQALIRDGKINYPQYVDLLDKGGITRYSVEVATHRVTYYGISGEAYAEQGPAVSVEASGRFDVKVIQVAIAEIQKRSIDYLTFLKKIHQAGVSTYDVNIRSRKIAYRGAVESYHENIPTALEVQAVVSEPVKTKVEAKETAPKKATSRTTKKVVASKVEPAKPAAKKKKKKLVKVSNSLKARKAKKRKGYRAKRRK